MYSKCINLSKKAKKIICNTKKWEYNSDLDDGFYIFIVYEEHTKNTIGTNGKEKTEKQKWMFSILIRMK